MVIRSLQWAPSLPEKHRYRPLPTNDSVIRVIELEPYDPAAARPRCRLRQHRLFADDSPLFDAVSYSWNAPVLSAAEIAAGGGPAGAPSDPDAFHEVEVDGASWMVTESLHEVLDAFSRRAERPTRPLWVDALCINQTDADEKAGQIALMGAIYARAARVVVWLGRDPAFVDDFAWIHGDFGVALNRLVERDGFDAVAARYPLDRAFFADLGLEMPLDAWFRCWRSYFRFYECRRWFRRAWIVQEAALARSVVVWCGGSAIDWQAMWAMARFVLISGWGQVLAPLQQKDKAAGVDQLDTIWVLQNVCRSGGVQAPTFYRNHQRPHQLRTLNQWCSWYFLWSLNVIRGQHATDARDKVFSILGLAERCTPAGARTPVAASYKIDAEDLYMLVARKSLRTLPLLSILSTVEAPTGTESLDLPSWVPDWSRSGPTGQQLGWADVMGQPIFDCSRVDAGFGHISSVSNRHLLVCGGRFDRVVDVSESMEVMMTTHRISSLLRVCLGLSDIYTQTAQGRVETLWRTLIADWTGSEHPAPRLVASAFHDWVLTMLSAGIYLRRSRDESVNKHMTELGMLDELISSADGCALPTRDQVVAKAEYLWTELEQYGSRNDDERLDFAKNADGEAALYGQRLSLVCGGRRLYRTAGGYLGLGPKSLKKGDEVWLIQGARVPFILRTDIERDAQVIVGETYLHGFMHGEMMDACAGRLHPICIA